MVRASWRGCYPGAETREDRSILVIDFMLGWPFVSRSTGTSPREAFHTISGNATCSRHYRRSSASPGGAVGPSSRHPTASASICAVRGAASTSTLVGGFAALLRHAGTGPAILAITVVRIWLNVKRLHYTFCHVLNHTISNMLKKATYQMLKFSGAPEQIH